MHNEKQLVKDCLKGKLAAQKELYNSFAPSMLGVCYRYTKSVHDAEDVMQEGFMKVFRFLQQFKGEGDLGAWIRRIMVNSSLNYLKRNRNYQYEMVFDKTELHVVSQDDPDMLLQAKDLADLIRQLPIGYQTIFNLYAVEGYSHPEIGGLMGISENTSRSQYMRARHLLISWLTNNAGNKNKVYAK